MKCAQMCQMDKEGTDVSGKEGTDVSGEEGTDSSDGEDLLKIDKGGLVGHRNMCYCTTISGHFYWRGHVLRQFLAILVLLTTFAKISIC